MPDAPLILTTLGDPAGLGPELACRVLSSGLPRPVRLVLVGPPRPLARSLKALGLPPLHRPVASLEEAAAQGPGIYLFTPPGLRDCDPEPGRPSPEGGRAAGMSLEAVLPALNSGLAHGLVTCPLNKAMLAAAGFPFPGHTEFLAEGGGVGREGVCMHLCGPRLRVSLVTTHPPLAAVPGLVTAGRILRCLRLTADHLERIGAAGPIAVCGLNPHAGEDGCIGCEDRDVIAPAVAEAAAQGIPAVGPLPGDTVFHFAARGKYAAVLAMYHDQGLAPLKLLHFGEAVNVTLGLPWPRTSPDHGTGYDLVGTGRAGTESLSAALDLCLKMVG